MTMSLRNRLAQAHFIGLNVLVLGAVNLVACQSDLGITATSTHLPTPTYTAKPPTPSPSPPPPTRTPTAVPCLSLLEPASAAELPALGKVFFSWEAMQGAVMYQLRIAQPDGQVLTWEVPDLAVPRYMESFPAAGRYIWQVAAIDASGQLICTTETFTFSKPEPDRPVKPGGT